MTTVLIAIVCARHFCMDFWVPTPAKFTIGGCEHLGFHMAAPLVPKNWRLVAIDCLPAVDV